MGLRSRKNMKQTARSFRQFGNRRVAFNLKLKNGSSALNCFFTTNARSSRAVFNFANTFKLHFRSFSTAADEDEKVASQTRVADILNIPKAIQIRKRLEEESSERITRETFLNICSEEGLSADSAIKLLDAFQISGIAVHFPKSDYVHVKPGIIHDMVLEYVDPSRNHLKTALEEQKKLLADTLRDAEDIFKQNNEIEVKAIRSANIKTFLTLGALVGFAGLLARLIWWELSWDIMEPITYYMSLIMGIWGLFYFAIKRKEYTYENLYDSWKINKRQALKKKLNFNQEKFDFLTHRIAVIRNRIESISSNLRIKEFHDKLQTPKSSTATADAAKPITDTTVNPPKSK